MTTTMEWPRIHRSTLSLRCIPHERERVREMILPNHEYIRKSLNNLSFVDKESMRLGDEMGVKYHRVKSV